jgi:hypothetical protein
MGWFTRTSKGPQTYCVPNAILCAWTWGALRKDEVRIAVTSISTGLDHSQAEALIDSKWTPLTEVWTGQFMEIQPWTRHYPDKEPYRYLSLKEWIDEQIQFTVPPI